MSTELSALRNLWQTTPGPNDQTHAHARARLLVEIDGETRRVLGRVPMARWHGVLPRRLGLVLMAVIVLFLLVVGVAFTFGLGLPVLEFGQAEKAPPESRIVKNFAVLDQRCSTGNGH
jgi:hypothetical protein